MEQAWFWVAGLFQSGRRGTEKDGISLVKRHDYALCPTGL